MKWNEFQRNQINDVFTNPFVCGINTTDEKTEICVLHYKK